MLRTYYISLFFILFFTSCSQNKKLEIQLDNHIIKNDTFSNISLHDAVRAKDFEKVKEIVSDGFLLNTQDKYDFTALHLAVRFNQYDIVEFLIRKKVSVNTVDIYGDTPLLESVRNRTDDISKLLLCSGAKKDIKDKNLLTPLDYASLYEDLSMVQMLESSDIKLICGKEGRILVQKAVVNNSNIDIKKEINIEKLGLYDALKNEFDADLPIWNAEIKNGSLTFRFKNTDMLFAHGSSDLSSTYKFILDDFFPRYLSVLNKYKDQIALVKIEGHTSSVYSSAKDEKDKYNKNKELSTKRANSVFEYLSSIANKSITEHKSWLNEYVRPYGMGYDKLIYTQGVEDEVLSRRVDFVIIKKK